VVELVEEDEERQLIWVVDFDVVAGFPPGFSAGVGAGDVGFDSEGVSVLGSQVDVDTREI